jgi:hypothetical protein
VTTLAIIIIMCSAWGGGGCTQQHGAGIKDSDLPHHVAEWWEGTNYHKAVLTSDQYYHNFLLMCNPERGEPNAKFEVRIVHFK